MCKNDAFSKSGRDVGQISVKRNRANDVLASFHKCDF